MSRFDGPSTAAFPIPRASFYGVRGGNAPAAAFI